MFSDLFEPTYSHAWGYFFVFLQVVLNGLLAFLARLTYQLRAKEWVIVSAFFIAACLMNFLLPHPTIRSFFAGDGFPPGDAIRLLMTVGGLITGFAVTYRALMGHIMRGSMPASRAQK